MLRRASWPVPCREHAEETAPADGRRTGEQAGEEEKQTPEYCPLLQKLEAEVTRSQSSTSTPAHYLLFLNLAEPTL
jgi:hypothetical protein